ncbi:MAG: hypothetical protein KF857_04450 [Fimbriimonadaceae bacterium]|nr:hypothetical protein [Fimbriimonadaceae bacterium]
MGKRLWRTILWFARVGMAWVPALFMLAWGVEYVRACVATVLAPGEPVTYAYLSSDGVVTLRADSYVIDVVNQRVLLKGLSLSRPDGQVVGRSAEAFVANRPGSFRVVLKSAEASLERGKNGKVNVAGLLPKPTGEPDKTRLEVEVDRLTLNYRDLTGPTPLARRVVVKDLSVARADGDTLAYADVQGAATVAAWAKPDGDWSADVRLSGGDLAWLVEPARRWAPGRGGDWSAETLAGRGRMQLTGKAGRISATGDLDLKAGGLTVGDTLQRAEVTAEVRGGLDQMKVVARATEQGRSATFDGVVAFGDQVAAAGKFRATVRSRADAWPVLARALPKDVRFGNAVYAGSVSYRDGRPVVVGDLTADKVSAGGLDLDKVKGTVGVSGDRVALVAKSIGLMGTDWSGRIDLDIKSGALKGFAETRDDFAKLLPRDSDLHFVAPGHAKVIVAGTTTHLTATMDGAAKVAWLRPDGPSVELGDLVARASLKDGKVTLDRCLFSGAAGAAKLAGTIDIQDKVLDLRASVPGVRLEPFFDTVQGTVATDLTVTGPVDGWHYEGRVEAYGVETPELSVPQVVALYTGDREGLTVSEFRARLLGGRLTGTGYVDLVERSLAADFTAQDLDVARLTQGEVVGQVDLTDGHIGGTLDAIVADTRATSVGLVAQGVRIDDASALVTLDGGQINLTGAKATVGGGQVTADGFLELDTLAMSFAGGWDKVNLASLVPNALDLSTEGTTSGEFVWGDPGVGMPGGYARAQIDSLSLAHLELGSGDIDAELSGGHFRASGLIGTIDRYVHLVAMDYDIESDKVAAQADIAEFGLRQAVTAALARAPDIPLETRNMVQTLGGSVSAHVEVSGTATEPVVSVPSLTVDDISADGRPMGDLVANGDYSKGKWNLGQLLWTKGDARIDATGSLDGGDNLAGKLEVVGLSMADVGAFIPGVDIDQGTASATMLFSGKSGAPVARGSAKLDKVVLRDGAGGRVNIPLSANVSEITWRDGLLVSDGDFTVATDQVQGGLTGGFTLDLPTVGWGVDDTRPVGVAVRMDDRPLAALAGLWPEIEEAGTTGSVSAQIKVSARKGDILVGGTAKVVADSKGQSMLKLKSLAEPVRDVAAQIDFGGRSAKIKASATSPFGGTVALDADLDADEALRQAFSVENLLAGSTVNAMLTMDKLGWRGRMNGADRTSAIVLDGQLTAAGRLDEPTVGGRVELHGAALNVAPGPPPGAMPDKPLVDPVFDNVTVVADHGTQVNVAAASVNLFGTGVLSGSLSDPNFAAELGLDGGALRLPSNRITLDEDGRIKVLVEGYPPSVRVDVDLTGRTVVTARQTSDQYQTYTVNLDIKGNLLGDTPLQIIGTSDPPDLTNEQIMAILGERQLIESLADSALGKGSSQGLRDSFYSVALPTLTAGLTENLAQGLGLDYLLLDYNPLDQALVRAGKNLGRGFMLQGVRQLAEPTFGRTKYEIALSYRPPFRDRFFSRVRFTLSQDQDVPWKLGFGWSIRF